MLRKTIVAVPVPIADRRLDARYVGPLNGSYTLSERNGAQGTGVEVFACRSQSISASAASVIAPAIGGIGEWLTARFDGLGIVRGSIIRHLSDGFAFGIVGSATQQLKLASKIEALMQRSIRVREDKRGYRRFQPRDPRSTLSLEDGRMLRCFVINISRSGAAVSAEYAPPVGAPVVIGTLACHVIRPLDVGFAVQFDAPQEAEGLEGMLTGYEPGVQTYTPPLWDPAAAKD